MKYIWTEKDAIVGRYVCKTRKEDAPTTKDDFSGLAMTTWKICYNTASHEHKFHLVAMTDGAILLGHTKESLVGCLNGEGYIPMPHKWLMGVMDAMRDWYEGN